MCTYATECLELRGSGKVGGTWAPLGRATVYLDHPYATALEHTLNVDLFGCGGSRAIALELSLESAHELHEAIGRALGISPAGPPAELSTAPDARMFGCSGSG
ncbi:MAG: DUF6295 family protein [Candidatus Dormibacteria bacterium]